MPVAQADDTSHEEAFTLDFDENLTIGSSQGGAFWDQWIDNLRFNIDSVSRVETTRRRGQTAGLNAVGLDIHKIISDSDGDIGTAVLQTYIVRRDNALPIPMHVEDDDDWDGEFHDFYFNLR